MDEFGYEADQEEEEEELGMPKRGKDDLGNNNDADDIEYVGLIWTGSSLVLSQGSTSACLDLSKTYCIPMNAFDELSTRKWKHLRFNLTDNSVFAWLDSNKKNQKRIKEIIVCLPEPRGFENGTPRSSFHDGGSKLKTAKLHRYNRKKGKRERRGTPPAATTRGIEGFLRRGVEQFSFQTTLTTWFQGLDQFFKNTRPGPFWWPSKTASRFCDREDRFLNIIETLPNLHNITVIMGPCSRMGYKNLDNLILAVSQIREKVSLVIQYVDEDGFEDAYLHIKDCDYELSNTMANKYEEFEAIRRVDGTSLQFFEWTKWILWVGLNLILWVFILRLLFYVVFRV